MHAALRINRLTAGVDQPEAARNCGNRDVRRANMRNRQFFALVVEPRSAVVLAVGIHQIVICVSFAFAPDPRHMQISVRPKAIAVWV